MVFSGLNKPIGDVGFHLICRCQLFVDYFANYFVHIINQIHYINNCTNRLFNEGELNSLRHVELQFAKSKG